MAIKGLYRGFSSYRFGRNKRFRVQDVELVKQDLLNHIFTKKGERVMMPNFGSVIPELVFEPLTNDLVELVEEEVIRIIDYDPRVLLLNIDVQPNFETQSVMVAAKVLYVELNMTDYFELNIEFEQ